MKIYIVGEGMYVKRDYANWLPGTVTQKMAEADLVIFTGGEDVSPKLYGQKEHESTQTNPLRDKYEILMYKEARRLKKPLLGICRGAQFLCVMAGGILVQDQDNPYRWHWVRNEKNEFHLTTSTHHQAQYPWRMKKDDYKVIGWTSKISPYHSGGNDEEMIHGVIDPVKEVEIAFYPKINALCIQGHPELMWPHRHDYKDVPPALEYFNGLVKDLLNKKL